MHACVWAFRLVGLLFAGPRAKSVIDFFGYKLSECHLLQSSLLQSRSCSQQAIFLGQWQDSDRFYLSKVGLSVALRRDYTKEHVSTWSSKGKKSATVW